MLYRQTAEASSEGAETAGATADSGASGEEVIDAEYKEDN